MSAAPQVDAFSASFPRRAAGPLDPFARAGIVTSADAHVAALLARLARLAGDVDDDTLLAAALAVRAPRTGHTCVDLATIAERAAPGDDAPLSDSDLSWPDARPWLAAVAESPLTGDGAPLVLEGSLLYLDRYWREECHVADALRALLDAGPADVDEPALTDGLGRLFPEQSRQRDAADVAVRNRLAILAGGPGTGKTTTVARVVALHVEQALAAGRPSPLVALAAPTGKAAARLTEAVGEELDRLGDALAPEVREAVGALQATTLHRLLGWRPDSASRFRHDRTNRLPHDLVVIDETSMVSLTLMARLLEALRPDARLVLVGDPGQLASIEAGTVLGDLVQAAEPAGAPLHPVTVTLTDPHRFKDGIAAVAAAIHSGDPDAVIDALRSHDDDVAWLEADAAAPETELTTVRMLATAAASGVREAAQQGDADAALSALASFRLLLAHRSGPYGVSHWNRQVEHWTTPARDRDDEWYVGRPVLVVANDASLGLYNGDLGVVVQRADHRAVVFDRRPERLELSPSRLGDVETVHAMTIHKSQGSQFDAVAVLLPDVTSRILTRELLYTGVTRAKHRLLVVGDEPTIRAAVERPIDRASGLARRLASAAAPTARAR
jgi:exodeoxyribonuclease V alpha subunit